MGLMSETEDESPDLFGMVGILTICVALGWVWWHLGGWLGTLDPLPEWAPTAVRFFGYGIGVGVLARK